MDGWTTCGQIKDIMRKQNLPDTPIFGLTGEDKHRNQERFNKSGMNRLIQKPVYRDELSDLVKKYRPMLQT